MWFFYTIATIILIIGLVIWIKNNNITWQEWIGSAVAAYVTAVLFQCIAIYGMTDDIETWSGQITHEAHMGQWVEEYQQRHSETYTTGSGKNQRTHTRVWYTTEHATHPEHWVSYLTFGEINDEKEISLDQFNIIKSKFGNVIEDGGRQSCTYGGHFDYGDNRIYVAPNKTGYLYPVTTIRHFTNKIKAAPTVFSFPKVPSNSPVYFWPENPNYMVSDRLIGESRISVLEFDRMNTRLGPKKFVNVIMINFGNKDSDIAQWQQAKWIGGKKNDLVLCYGQIGTNGLPTWSKVFGWTESEMVKRNLETILLEHVADNSILELIKTEIVKSYQIKDWSKFDYISIEPPTWSYVWFIVILSITQVGMWWWFNDNEFTKESVNRFGKFNSYNRNLLRRY